MENDDFLTKYQSSPTINKNLPFNITSMIQWYGKICKVLEVLSLNSLNHILIHKTNLPILLMINLVGILDSLERYKCDSQSLKTNLIASTLKVLSITLRYIPVIRTFVQHDEKLFHKLVQIIKMNICDSSIVYNGLLVIK